MYLAKQVINYHGLFDTLIPNMEIEGWVVHERGIDNTSFLNGGEYFIAESPVGGCIAMGLDYNESYGVYTLVGNCFPNYESTLNWHDQNSSANTGTYDEHSRITLSLDFNAIIWISSRRVIIANQKEANYHAMYLGRFTAYAPPNVYVYPLYSAGAYEAGNYKAHSSPTNSIFDITNTSVGNFSYGHNLTFYPDAEWRDSARHWPCDDQNTLAKNADGSYPLLPVTLFDTNTVTGNFGTLEGVYKTSGEGLTPEDTVTIGAKEYLVIPNNYRRSFDDFYIIEKA